MGTPTYPRNLTQVIELPSFHVKKRENRTPIPNRSPESETLKFYSCHSYYKDKDLFVYLPDQLVNKLLIPDRFDRIEIRSFLCRIPTEEDSRHRTDHKRQYNRIQLHIPAIPQPT